MLVIIEHYTRFDQLAFFFDINLLGSIHHDFADFRIIEQNLNGTIADNIRINRTKNIIPGDIGEMDASLQVNALQSFRHKS